MARWKLATAHYLNSIGIEWEYKEVSRVTGRVKRHVFPVPLFIDPQDPADWTNRWGPGHDNEEGECVVCHEGKGEPTDIVFIGDPTPDMIPVDAEARAITAKLSPRWNARPEAIGNYGQSVVSELQDKMVVVQTEPPRAVVEGMSELVAAITSMVAQNNEVMRTMAQGPRRV